MDLRAVVAAIAILAMAPLVALGVTSSPLLAGGAILAVAAGLLLLAREQWIAPLLALGFMYNAVFVSLGFAFLGVGDGVALMSFGAWFIHRLGRPRPFRLKHISLMILFMIICYVSLVNGVMPGASKGPYMRQVVYMLGLVIMMDTLRNFTQLRWVMYALAIASVIHCVYAVVSYDGVRRLRGFVDQPNTLAHLVAFGMLPTLERFQNNTDSTRRVLWMGAFMLQVAVIVMSVSRGTILALAVALLWWVRANRGQVLIILVGGLAVFIAMKGIEDRPTQNIVQDRLAMKDASLHHRTEIFGYGVEALFTHPWLGVGFNQFTELDRAIDLSQNASGRAAHNYYLNIAVSVGLPGVFLLLGFCWLHSRRVWQHHRWLSQLRSRTPEQNEAMVLLSLLQCVILFETVGLMTKGDMMGLLWMLMGVTAAASQLELPTSDDDRSSVTTP